MKKSLLGGVFGLLCFPAFVQAQAITKDYTVVTTAVPFMTLSPDSKAASMGDAGVASAPDANSVFWNTAKLAFTENKMGASFSYAPWLRDIVGDMGLMSLQGYYRLNSKQSFGYGVTYFNQGLIEFTTANAEPAGNFQSREFNITAGFSQKLNASLSTGLNMKFINSNLVGTLVTGNQAGKPGRTAAFDFGIYYNKTRPTDKTGDNPKKVDMDFGVVVQNIGGKVNYGFSQYFIPANLKLGTKITLKPDDLNAFNFLVDFNKLLVPTPKPEDNISDITVFKSIFSSFADAPGGFEEELKEVMASLGAEYTYSDLIALRAGYFHESKYKGSRQYFTAGFGLSLKEIYRIDLAYLIPTTSGNPLANSWRISLNVKLPNGLRGSRNLEIEAEDEEE
ncbi:MAG: type IX secretion system outer membrane channel protein PorV [Bacteroidetes bacterium]|nr:type IX secretion system outer membrane channel protein PorV [Bacteroidota bacterium]